MPACIFTCITYRDTSKHPDPGLNLVLSVLYCAMWQCSLLGQGQHLEVSLTVVDSVDLLWFCWQETFLCHLHERWQWGCEVVACYTTTWAWAGKRLSSLWLTITMWHEKTNVWQEHMESAKLCRRCSSGEILIKLSISWSRKNAV